MKKVIANLVYGSVKGLENGEYDLGMVINEQDLINLPLEEVIKILNQHNLINGDDIIIPEGLNLVETKQFGGAMEYTFQGEDLKITTDLFFDEDEDKYIA